MESRIHTYALFVTRVINVMAELVWWKIELANKLDVVTEAGQSQLLE